MVVGTLIVFFLAGGGVYGTGNECTIAPFATESDAGFSIADCKAGDSEAVDAYNAYADDTFANAQTMTFTFSLYSSCLTSSIVDPKRRVYSLSVCFRIVRSTTQF